ncbi:hypothetical protein HYV50_01085 [Candidatus Pacearchaeota archaeon]|nr:hypothetical protein [Candidatus Pacearchaeota archaeon]
MEERGEGSKILAQYFTARDDNLISQLMKRYIKTLVKSGPEGGYDSDRILPLTPRAKKCLEYMIEEVNNSNIHVFGTGYLLLGLLREQDSVAAQVLMSCDVGLEQLRLLVQENYGRVSK